jgi:hypothetical protein
MEHEYSGCSVVAVGAASMCFVVTLWVQSQVEGGRGPRSRLWAGTVGSV